MSDKPFHPRAFGSSCPVCGATVAIGEDANRHLTWHQKVTDTIGNAARLVLEIADKSGVLRSDERRDALRELGLIGDDKL